MAVVGALDLHEHVAAGVRAHQPRGLERRLGARVAEPPQRQAEPLGEVLADHVELLRRLREVRAARGLALDRLDDLRVRVAHHHRAVAEVEVDVLVLVDVPDAVALAAVGVDRVRRASPASSRPLPRRRGARPPSGTRSTPRCFGSSVASSVAMRLIDLSRSNSTVSRTATVVRLLGEPMNGRSTMRSERLQPRVSRVRPAHARRQGRGARRYNRDSRTWWP